MRCVPPALGVYARASEVSKRTLTGERGEVVVGAAAQLMLV